jgi:hypothetical protein
LGLSLPELSKKIGKRELKIGTNLRQAGPLFVAGERIKTYSLIAGGGNKKAPATGLWVKDGTRTRDLQNHNLAF